MELEAKLIADEWDGSGAEILYVRRKQTSSRIGKKNIYVAYTII